MLKESEGVTRPRTAWFDVPESAESTTEIVFPDGRIEARVIDAESGAPLSGVSVSHSYQSGDTAGVAFLKSDEDGRIEVLNAPVGQHTLAVKSPQYLSWSTELTIGGVSEHHDLTIALEKGIQVQVAVMSEKKPQVNAYLYEMLADRPSHESRLFLRTDASGVATIQMREGERRSFFVAISSGGFTFVEVGADQERTTVDVPPVAGTLEIHTIDDGHPVPKQIVFSHEGRFLSSDLLEMLAGISGASFYTSESGTTRVRLPAGNMTLWAFDDLSHNLRVDQPPKRPGVALVFAGGEQTVTVADHERNLVATGEGAN